MCWEKDNICGEERKAFFHFRFREIVISQIGCGGGGGEGGNVLSSVWLSRFAPGSRCPPLPSPALRSKKFPLHFPFMLSKGKS